MARNTNDSHTGGTTSHTTDVDDVLAHLSAFGSWVTALDFSQVSNAKLHSLVAAFGGLDAQVDVALANVLAEIKLRGGDPVGSQKKHAKSSHAASKKKADRSAALNDMPNVKGKMSNGGGMSGGKASLLAGAAKKTSANDVDGDERLLVKVENQDEDAAKETIDTWVRERQSNGDRKSQRQKNIDARQFWMFVKDGMVHRHGKAPANVRNMARLRRWEAEKSRLWRLDGGRESAHTSVRSDEQRGADAYANIISGGPLLRSELERLMCDCELFGVLYDPETGVPLFAGRGVRTCTDAQWRALLVRDGGCVLTGVDPSQCEAHHIVPYEAPAKGRSDINNLVLVSVSIHHWLHDNKLTIYQKPDGVWDTRPATADEIAPRGRRPATDRSKPPTHRAPRRAAAESGNA